MMVAVQFDKVGGTAQTFDEAFNLNVTGAKAWNSIDDPECIAGWYADAPCLKIPNGTVNMGYLDLYWCQNAYSESAGEFVAGWADKDGFYVDSATMLDGYGVWLVAGSADMTVTINGEVKSDASDTISAGAGYNMLKLPYPVALNADSEKIDWNLTGVKAWNSIDDPECISGWTATAPAIKIPNGTVNMGYLDLFYSSNAYSESAGDFVVGWADKDGFYVADAVIKEGMAFWLVVPSATTSTITK